MVCPATVTPILAGFINYFGPVLYATVTSWTPLDATCHVVGLNSRCEVDSPAKAININYALSDMNYGNEVEARFVLQHATIFPTILECYNGTPFDIVDVGDLARTIPALGMNLLPNTFNSIVLYDAIGARLVSQHTWYVAKCLG